MNRCAIGTVILLALALAAPARQDAPPQEQPQQESQQETKQEAKPAPKQPAAKSGETVPPDSPLVAAAKRAKGGKIQPGLVITNENVRKIKGVGGSVTYGVPADPNAPPYDPTLGTPPGSDRGKEDWQQLIGSARSAVAASESRIDSLQSEVSKLQNDFYAWDDPAYRDGVIKPALDQALADLEAEKQALSAARQRVLDIEEEARKAGAHPGWLR
jgi:hypothetical protein